MKYIRIERALALAAIEAGMTSGGLAHAQAQQLDRASVMAACRADYLQHCTFVMPGGGRIMACLGDAIEQIHF